MKKIRTHHFLEMAKAWSEILVSRCLNFWSSEKLYSEILSFMHPYWIIRNSYTLQAKMQPHITVSNFQRSFLSKKNCGSWITDLTRRNVILNLDLQCKKKSKNVIEIKNMEETLVFGTTYQLWRLYVHYRIRWKFLNEVTSHSEAWNVPKDSHMTMSNHNQNYKSNQLMLFREIIVVCCENYINFVGKI